MHTTAESVSARRHSARTHHPGASPLTISLGLLGTTHVAPTYLPMIGNGRTAGGAALALHTRAFSHHARDAAAAFELRVREP